MAAPTSTVQKLQKILANAEPSTHGLKQRYARRSSVDVAKNFCLDQGLPGAVAVDPRQGQDAGAGDLIGAGEIKARAVIGLGGVLGKSFAHIGGAFLRGGDEEHAVSLPAKLDLVQFLIVAGNVARKFA